MQPEKPASELYVQINRKNILSTLVNKFGGVETAKYFLADALSDLQSMEVGAAENNAMLAAKHMESLRQNLTNLNLLLNTKEYKGSVEKAVKENVA